MESAWALTPCRGPGAWAGYSSPGPQSLQSFLLDLPPCREPEELMRAFLLLLQGLPLSPFIWPTPVFAHGAWAEQTWATS